MAGKTVEWTDVQGLVLRGYDALRYANYILLQIADVERAKAWMSGLEPTRATESPNDQAMHIALTAAGLTKLGVAAYELGTFSIPFQQGLVAEHRSRILGDVGSNSPGSWGWGGTAASSPDVLLLLFDAQQDHLSTRSSQVTEAATGCRILQILEARTPDDGRDHFGFMDGISQPKIRQAPKADGTSDVDAGEFVLGYPDSRGEVQPVPTLGSASEAKDPVGENGTYLVLRQIEQHVDAFHQWFERRGGGASNRELAAAKLIGRWRDGRPLVDSGSSSGAPTPNAYFDFSRDRFGLQCPLGAHVRRANPRDDLRGSDQSDNESAKLSKTIVSHHRIIRRGRIYGRLWRPSAEEPQPDSSARGLYFMCLNASISNQFEFIQQAWLNSPSFRGLYEEVDPIVGPSDTDQREFTVQAEPVRRRFLDLPRLTTVRGGAYFFMAGIRALRKLTARNIQVQ